MIYCHQLSDRMPEVATGRARWNADEERHLAGCDACRLEWELVRRTARLGTSQLRINEAAIAEAVLRRARATDVTVPRRRVWAISGLVAAASIALLIWGKVLPTRSSVPVAPPERTVATAPVETGQLGLSVPELDDLRTDELDTMLRSLDRPLQADELLESSWEDAENR